MRHSWQLTEKSELSGPRYDSQFVCRRAVCGDARSSFVRQHVRQSVRSLSDLLTWKLKLRANQGSGAREKKTQRMWGFPGRTVTICDSNKFCQIACIDALPCRQALPRGWSFQPRCSRLKVQAAPQAQRGGSWAALGTER